MSKEQKRKHNLALAYNIDKLQDLQTSGRLTDAGLLEILDDLRTSYHIDQAIEVATLAVELYPYQGDFYLYLAGLHINDNQPQLAHALLEKALCLNPGMIELEVLLVRVLAQVGAHDEAHDILDRLSERVYRADWGLLYIAQAYLYQSTQNYYGMYTAAKNAVTYCPESEEAYSLYSRAVELTKEFQDAVTFYNEILDEDPYAHLAWYHLAQAYAALCNYDRAVLAYEYAFIANPDFLQAYMDCAELCSELGYWRRSLFVNLDIVERFSETTDTLVQMARGYLHLGMVDPAHECLVKLARIDRDHDELFFLLGDCFFVQKQWGKAILAYDKALLTDEDNDEYIFRMARAKAKLGKHNEAAGLFQMAIDLGPEQDQYWFGYAKFLIKNNHLQAALELLAESEEYTVSPKLDYLRSIALLRSNKRQEGLFFLSAALEEDQGQLRLFYKYVPEAKEDQQIQSIINYFC